MSARIEAVFEGGVFRPLQPIDIPEGERVHLTISSGAESDPAADLSDLAVDTGKADLAESIDRARHGVPIQTEQEDAYTLPPLVTGESARARLLEEIVREMQEHPLTGNPPRLTRDELHERR